MFSFFKKQKTQPKKKVIRNLAGPHYRIVQGDLSQISPAMAETKPEDDILDLQKRLKFLDTCRQAVRNSPSINALLTNITNCVIGPDGFKFIYSGASNDEMDKLQRLFRGYCRDCGFFGKESFREFLSILLKSIIISGDAVIVCDNGLFRGQGRIMMFEADEIGNLSQDDFVKVYGKSAQQINGIATSALGETIGVIVSKSQRGKTVYDLDKSYTLKSDPTASSFDAPFLHVKYQSWRPNSYRGISPLASSIICAEQLDAVCENEIAVSRKSSQLLAQIYDTQTTSDQTLPSAFTEDEIEQMSDDEIKALAQSQQTQTVVGFERVPSVGAQIIQLPEGKKIEALDFSHPNLDVVEFLRLLQDRITSPLGIAGFFATYSPTTESRLANQMSWQTILTLQKQIERVADYVFYRFVKYCVSKGLIDETKLPEDYMYSVKWSHPTMASLDPVSQETANQMRLRNLTGNYSDILGSDWKERLTKAKEEIDFLKANDLPLPQYAMISGGESTGADSLEAKPEDIMTKE